MEYCYELGHYYETERGIDIFKMSTDHVQQKARLSRLPDGLFLHRQVSRRCRRLGHRLYPR